MKVLADGDELVYPRLQGPQFRMPVEIGIAAAYLVVGYHLPPCIGDAVEYLEIVVRTSRAAVKQQQGGFL